MPPLLIYIHGFCSSSRSEKAVAIGKLLSTDDLYIDYCAPDLANYPGEAYQQLCQLINREQAQGRERIGLIGSSLGGYMATCAAERYQLPAVLINPAVKPYEMMPKFLGEHVNFSTGERFILDESHRQQLLAMACEPLSAPQNYWIMLQTGDDTLDYRQAQVYYRHSPQLIEQGGSHRFDDFEQHLPKVLDFLKLL